MRLLVAVAFGAFALTCALHNPAPTPIDPPYPEVSRDAGTDR